MKRNVCIVAGIVLTVAIFSGCASSATDVVSENGSLSSESSSGIADTSAENGSSATDSEETVTESSSSTSSDSQDSSSSESGVPATLNSPNMDEWSNVVDGKEYYLTEDGSIAKRNADGSGDTVVIDGHSQTMYAMPEGILYTTDIDELYFSALDGSNVVKLDEDVTNGYTNIQIDDNYIYYYLVGDTSRQRIIDRATMEQVEIPENLVNDFAVVRVISDGRFYYFRSDDVFCSCNMNGEDEKELMTYPDSLFSDNIQKLVILNGDMYVNDVADTLYKFPAGTTEATEDMKISTPEGKDPQGFKLRNGEIYCSYRSGSYEMSFYKMDLDGNYIGDATQEEWDA